MSERIVHKIEKHQYANFGKKTVVIYARVSTNKPSQLHSMAMQVSALTQQVYLFSSMLRLSQIRRWFPSDCSGRS